jgi:hypothetical protein
MSDSCANVGFLIAPPLFPYFIIFFLLLTLETRKKSFYFPSLKEFFFKILLNPLNKTKKEKNEICSG